MSSFEMWDCTWEGGQLMTLGDSVDMRGVQMEQGLCLPDASSFCPAAATSAGAPGAPDSTTLSDVPAPDPAILITPAVIPDSVAPTAPAPTAAAPTTTPATPATTSNGNGNGNGKNKGKGNLSIFT